MVDEVAAAYDRVATTYDAAHRGNLDLAEDRAAIAWVRSGRALSGNRIVDVACGTGLLLDYCPELGPARYLGIDCSWGMLDVAHAKHPAHDFLKADLTTWAGEEVFDGVVSLFASVSHVMDIGVVPRQCATWLRPDGWAAVMYFGGQRARTLPAPIAEWWTAERAVLRVAWQAAGFVDVRVRPLNIHGRRLRHLPLAWLGRYLRWEMDHVGGEPVFWCVDARRGH